VIKSVKIKKKTIKEVNEDVYCLHVKDNHIVIGNNILSHNCRLLVDKSNSVGVNSFGVKIQNHGNDAEGSIRVLTLSLANLALEVKQKNISTESEYIVNLYYDLLKDKLKLAAKVLISQRNLVYKRDEEGFFQLPKVGWINLKKLSSTFGGLGLYEACKILSNNDFGSPYTNEELEIGNKILEIFNDACSEASKTYDVLFNMEVLVPGESMAFRLADRDKIDYSKEVNYTELSNQFSPLTLNFDFIERLQFENELSSKIPPTGICHINIEGSLTPEQNVRMHRALWKHFPFIQHYAFSSTIYNCENGHTECKTIKNKCMICGGEIIDITSRSIGYFKSVLNSFGKNRKNEYFRRKRYNKNIVEENL